MISWKRVHSELPKAGINEFLKIFDLKKDCKLGLKPIDNKCNLYLEKKDVHK